MIKVTFSQAIEYFEKQKLDSIICWACNNFERGSGYCEKHSTSGMRYRTNYYKEKRNPLKENIN